VSLGFSSDYIATTGLQKGKTFGDISFLIGQLPLLVKLTFSSLFVYMLESPKLTPFILQLNQAVLSLSDHQGCKPVSEEILLWGCAARAPGELRSVAVLYMYFVT
jgi:hypothetical protein